MQNGRISSLHIHPEKSGTEMLPVSKVDLVASKGIAQDKRYFGRHSANGEPSKRQVTLIERECIDAHAEALGCAMFPPGAVRSNIETEGLDLVPLEGKILQIGSARILVGAPRDPCHKMDKLAPGLRARMDNGRQGVLAQVVVSGKISVGDEIQVLEKP